ncbi:hypothetical protein V6N11_022988 [Hibiscus sabdariffa]|uniref:Secreted protein n=1 Tax=Hibiscus sabdariffa TaxID=183260 RepID=A0ABR2TL20_9ROSI
MLAASPSIITLSQLHTTARANGWTSLTCFASVSPTLPNAGPRFLMRGSHIQQPKRGWWTPTGYSHARTTWETRSVPIPFSM